MLLFDKCSPRNSAKTPAILTDNSVFHLVFPGNDEIFSLSQIIFFLLNPFQSIIPQSPHHMTLYCSDTDGAVKYTSRRSFRFYVINEIFF